MVAQANLTLKRSTIPSQPSLDDLKDYTKELNSITIQMGAKYDIYKQYENNPTDYITRSADYGTYIIAGAHVSKIRK